MQFQENVTAIKVAKLIEPGPSILIVGPDGVGKTTVAGKLSEKTDIPVFKCPVEKEIFKLGGAESLVFDYMLCEFLEQTRYRFISDRAYPCEWVYSRVFNRVTGEALLKEIDRKHSRLGTKILYLYSSVQPAEPDDIVPSEKYWEIKETYDQFCEWTDCEVVAYDTAESLELEGSWRAEYDAAVCMEALKL